MRPATPPSWVLEGEEPAAPSEPRRIDPPRVVRGIGSPVLTIAFRTGLAGTAVGVVAAAIPAAIIDLAAAWFTFSGADDPPLLWDLLATVLALLAVVAFVVAIVLARFRSTRAVGIGYMVGAAIGTILGVIGFAILFFVAVADTVMR